MFALWRSHNPVRKTKISDYRKIINYNPAYTKTSRIWECLPFVWKPGNFGENSNGTVHPGGNFPEKQVIRFEVLRFSRSYRNDRNLLYHLFGLPVSGFLSRESEKFTEYFVNGTTQSRSCFRCQKKYHYHLTEMFPRFALSNACDNSFSKVPYLEREEEITDQSNFVNNVT